LTPEEALRWSRIGAIGGLAMTPVFMLFILAFTRNYKWFGNLLTSILLFGINLVVFVILTEIDPVLPEHMERFPWGWTANFQKAPFVLLFAWIWGSFLTLVALFLCWRFYISTKDDQEKKQALFIIVALLIPTVLGLLSQLIVPRFGVETGAFNILYGLSSIVLVSSIGYAALKYKLFGSLTPASAARTIIETMKDALFVTDPAGRIAFVNSFSLEILGNKKSALVGKSLDVIFHKKNQILKTVILPKIKQNEAVIDLETKLLSQNGKAIDVNISASPLVNESGSSLGIVLIAKDIRKMKLLIKDLHKTTQELTEIKLNLERQIGRMSRTQY